MSTKILNMSGWIDLKFLKRLSDHSITAIIIKRPKSNNALGMSTNKLDKWALMGSAQSHVVLTGHRVRIFAVYRRGRRHD